MDDTKLDTLRDLTKFAKTFLIVKSKSGELKPFGFNRGQLYIHERLEAQLKDRGYVRAIILKARQLGCSTYIQARYFHKVITSKGRKAFILTHEAEATKNLFEMTKRFHDNLPSGLCPPADTSSAKELYFKAFDSGYAVGTAGNKGVGRSQTIQLMHASEVSFWPHAEEHAKGVLQAVSSEPGTEIILESTANGIGNYFHSMWKGAIEGRNGYQAIFVPWYWDAQYTLHTPGFDLYEEEQALLDYYRDDGLTINHLMWRRRKLNEFSSDHDAAIEQWKQEYPSSASEAFLNPISNVFINAKHVMRARKTQIDSDSPLIIGVDIAISERDKTAIIRRKGRVAYNLEYLTNHNTMEIAGRLKRIIQNENPAKVYIDCIGIGAGVVDRLQEMGFSCVEGINVGRSANDKERFWNLRAELWSDMRDWLTQEMPVQIPDDDGLHGELCSLGFKYKSGGQLLIESKDDLRARGMPSPDGADALSLTFFGGFYVEKREAYVQQRSLHEKRMFY